MEILLLKNFKKIINNTIPTKKNDIGKLKAFSICCKITIMYKTQKRYQYTSLCQMNVSSVNINARNK